MSPALAFGIRILLLPPLAFSGVLALAQGTTVETDRDQPRQREQWFMHGRLIPGESAAALRYRAHAQKMQLRAEQAARMNTAITAATTTAIGIWTPLGLAPLASDATGLGSRITAGFQGGPRRWRLIRRMRPAIPFTLAAPTEAFGNQPTPDRLARIPLT